MIWVMTATNKKNKGGRPSKYTKAMANKAIEYVESCEDKIEDYHKTQGVKSDSYERLVHVNIPTVEGLAEHLGVARSTVFKWAEEHEEFSDSLEFLNEQQKKRLIQGALGGHYSPTIAKLILSSNHDMVEKKEVDMTSAGEPIKGFNYIEPDDSDNQTD